MLRFVRKATDSFVEVSVYYVVIILISAFVFSQVESRGWGESVYWSVMTSTTVGFGDISPITIIGRIDAMLTAIVCVFFIVPLVIVRVGELVNLSKDTWTHEEQEEIKRQLAELKELLTSKQ